MQDDIETPRVLNRTTTYQGRLIRNSSQDLRQANQAISARNSGQSQDRASPALTRNGKLIIQQVKPKWSIDKYYKQTKFDPEAEVEKEDKIDDFFYQKF